MDSFTICVLPNQKKKEKAVVYWGNLGKYRDTRESPKISIYL